MHDRCRGSVLVLHPDPSERAALAGLLLERGFSVGTAADPGQAVERFAWPGVPDVLVVGGALHEEPLASFLGSLAMMPAVSEMLVALATGELPPPALAHRLLGAAPGPRGRVRLAELVEAGCRRRRGGRPLWQPVEAVPAGGPSPVP